MYRQASRIESAAAWPGRSRSATRPDDRDAGHRAIPGEPAVLTGARERSRGIEGGVPVAPPVGPEPRAHSGTATRERQSGRGSWSSHSWCREPKPPRVMRWLKRKSQVNARCRGPSPPSTRGRVRVRVRVPITVPDSDGHGLFNRGGDWTNCEFLGRVLGVSSVRWAIRLLGDPPAEREDTRRFSRR